MIIHIDKMSARDVARKIDFALLNREFGWEQYRRGCEETKAYCFAAYHVLPCWVAPANEYIGDFCRENAIEIGAPISFPYGTSPSAAKLKEAECLIADGATALDMVANIGWLKDKRYNDYLAECRNHASLCHEAGINAKIIIACGYLVAEEIEAAVKIVIESGADYVKTATGTGPAGRPDENDVRLIMDTIARAGARTKVKVSGIVEPRAVNAAKFIRMGADRIGTRAAQEIVDTWQQAVALLR
jgi:deoxyribose-phosphate aldolase